MYHASRDLKSPGDVVVHADSKSKASVPAPVILRIPKRAVMSPNEPNTRLSIADVIMRWIIDNSLGQTRLDRKSEGQCEERWPHQFDYDIVKVRVGRR